MPPDTLLYVPFAPDSLEMVRGHDYGEEAYQRELGDWLENDAVQALTRGTKVWLYRNQAGEFVGYQFAGNNSLALSRASIA